MCFSDDPYYCGLRARVPNFVKTNGVKHLPQMTERLTLKDAPVPSKRYSVAHAHPGPFLPHMAPYAHAPMPPAALWHARSYESGIGAYGPKKEKLMYKFYPDRERRLVRPLIIQQPR